MISFMASFYLPRHGQVRHIHISKLLHKIYMEYICDADTATGSRKRLAGFEVDGRRVMARALWPRGYNDGHFSNRIQRYLKKQEDILGLHPVHNMGPVEMRLDVRRAYIRGGVLANRGSGNNRMTASEADQEVEAILDLRLAYAHMLPFDGYEKLSDPAQSPLLGHTAGLGASVWRPSPDPEPDQSRYPLS